MEDAGVLLVEDLPEVGENDTPIGDAVETEDTASPDALSVSVDAFADAAGVLDDSLAGYAGELRTLNDTVNGLAGELRTFNESRSGESDSEQAEEATYTVVLEAGQVETFKTFGRLLCTEGLILIIAVALLCGLTCFRIFVTRWSV